MLNRTNSCCGIGELSGLESNPLTNIKRMCDDYFHIEEFEDNIDFVSTKKRKIPKVVYEDAFALVLFTDAIGNNNGNKFAKFIKKNKLGTLQASPIRRNHNSGNRIRSWVWSVNKPNLKKFYKKIIGHAK